MKTYDAVGKVEGFVEAESELDQAKALQQLINSGECWRLQGSFGRTAMDAIESGMNMLGRDSHRGNGIPSRSDVKPGTKGSKEFVVEHCGTAWANAIAKVR